MIKLEVKMTCAHTDKPCKNRHDCERCKVPEAFGFFLVWRKGKAEWEQRFILEADRAALIGYQQQIIRKAQAEIEKIRLIPGR